MSFAFVCVRKVATYTWRIGKKPLTKLVEVFSDAEPDAVDAARDANFFASKLQIAYAYYKEDGAEEDSAEEDSAEEDGADEEFAHASEKRWWDEYGYRIIPYTEFSDPDVRELLQSRKRQVVPLRKPRSCTSSGPDDIVILLRGTCFSSFSDMIADLLLACEILFLSKRFQSTEKLVKELVDQQFKKYGQQRIRIVGHSLGAAIGFIIARRLYLEDPSKSPEGHFFNLPFMDIDELLNMVYGMVELEIGLYNAAKGIIQGSPLGGLIGSASKMFLREKTIKEFANLKNFNPTIYLNKYDRVCNGYIPYFRNRTNYGNCSNGTTKFTAVLSILGCDIRSEHMCPSATLIIASKGIWTLSSHKLKKWIGLDAVELTVERHVS